MSHENWTHLLSHLTLYHGKVCYGIKMDLCLFSKDVYLTIVKERCARWNKLWKCNLYKCHKVLL